MQTLVKERHELPGMRTRLSIGLRSDWAEQEENRLG